MRDNINSAPAARDSGRVMIHGREYKTVALRINEFRQKYPDYQIETEIVRLENEFVVMRALIRDLGNRIVATGHAEEWRASSNINETSMVENAETSAVGRALAFLGFAGSEIASADEIEIALRKRRTMGEGASPREGGRDGGGSGGTRETRTVYSTYVDYFESNGHSKEELDLLLALYRPDKSPEEALRGKNMKEALGRYVVENPRSLQDIFTERVSRLDEGDRQKIMDSLEKRGVIVQGNNSNFRDRLNDVIQVWVESQ
ncbi:MAG: hypothetical protein C4524_04210 [Candidatus Zixiibacteriota bacterium]|nr:MAG: hypothetical protein C4524_04210 [candidate division Zixibacteria bacterium]